MKTQDIALEKEPPQAKRGSWLASLGTVLVVALIVGASVVVFTQLSMHRSRNTATAAALAGHWTPVLQGYAITSLMAANSSPSLLYACATKTELYGHIPLMPPTYGGTGSITTTMTVLRSTDNGGHWQDIGNALHTSNSCQLAVNPANGNELYAVVRGSSSSNGQVSSVLKHSTDGGKSWTTILPRLVGPTAHAVGVWDVGRISLVGGRLFGMQALPLPNGAAGQAHSGGTPVAIPVVTRLVTSTDGGHSWTVIDSQFQASELTALEYVVDPSNAGTVYELVGRAWGHFLVINRASSVLPTTRMSQDLYKTTDGGVTWHALLKNLAGNMQVALARDNSQRIYVGGMITPLPGTSLPPTSAFYLRMSSDGGVIWHDVPSPAKATYVQSWVVTASGDVYTAATTFATGFGSSAMPPAIHGTAVPVILPGMPKAGLPSHTGAGFTKMRPDLMPRYSGGMQFRIQRYDPNTSRWSELTSPPMNGTLLTNVYGADSVWFMARMTLYRFDG